MEVIIKPDAAAVSKEAAGFYRKQLYDKPASVLGFATGGTPLGLYGELAALYRCGQLDFSQVTTFNLDEYAGLGPAHGQSYRRYMDENLFSKINVVPGRTFFP